ncbi:ABC transporter permease [Bordetella hinzii]|uniref:ABC transporter, permease protein n=1 Tax=Bordetella hinzii OH87 BAL007II TaxID=1331262 RepID=A0ABR4R2U8_9BORD|nr:ABC transporter permease [Bordetella hinzii]KCB25059.1 ABC transporter, permease protein [Bordetella hinzii OH87 BAL007II]KCB44207.1 ABC transporter, permease protein [Bordetella hinzii 5132]QDJ34799.1 ABC transporter permease [Bordetella hinzii]QDJ43937.1 ABC transporter permease [Bordetella hinzii]QDJ48457.1 ABC transporter permease [Bordetella hinzii]
MTLLRLIGRRLVWALITLWLVSVFIFMAVELMPGDAAEALLGKDATPQAVENLRRALRLDEPATTRYLAWLGDMAAGNAGQSLVTGMPIAPVLGERLGNTLFLAVSAAVVAVPLALALGLLSALKQGTAADRVISVVSLASISFPEFFMGYVLLLVFGLQLGWLPVLSTVNPDMALGERVLRIVLPALTLVCMVMAYMMRMTRAAVINVLSHPYIEMARLKGCSPGQIVLRHAFINAVGPVINVVAISLAYLVVGVVVVEVIFTYPGMGQWMVDAVSKRDIQVVQVCGLVFGAAYIGLNLVADVTALAFNPKLRHPR